MSEECYSGHAEVPLVNALDECRQERDKLRAAAKVIADALCNIDTEARLLLERDECEMECEDIMDMCGQALTIAKELGLLKDE